MFSALKTQVPQQAKKRFGVYQKACSQGKKKENTYTPKSLQGVCGGPLRAILVYRFLPPTLGPFESKTDPRNCTNPSHVKSRCTAQATFFHFEEAMAVTEEAMKMLQRAMMLSAEEHFIRSKEQWRELLIWSFRSCKVLRQVSCTLQRDSSLRRLHDEFYSAPSGVRRQRRVFWLEAAAIVHWPPPSEVFGFCLAAGWWSVILWFEVICLVLWMWRPSACLWTCSGSEFSTDGELGKRGFRSLLKLSHSLEEEDTLRELGSYILRDAPEP